MPSVPVSGITMEETVIYARRLAERIGRAHIPVFVMKTQHLRRNAGTCKLQGRGV